MGRNGSLFKVPRQQNPWANGGVGDAPLEAREKLVSTGSGCFVMPPISQWAKSVELSSFLVVLKYR